MIIKSPEEIENISKKLARAAKKFLKIKTDINNVVTNEDYSDVEPLLIDFLQVCLLDSNWQKYCYNIAGYVLEAPHELQFFTRVKTKEDVRQFADSLSQKPEAAEIFSQM